MSNEISPNTGRQANRALWCMAGIVAAMMILFLVMAVSPASAQTGESAQSDQTEGVQSAGANDVADAVLVETQQQQAELGTGMVQASSDGSLSGAAATDEEAADTAAGLAMILMAGAGAVVVHETLRG